MTLPQPATCSVSPSVAWIPERQWLQQHSRVHTMVTCWQGLWAYRFYLFVYFLPIILLPLPILIPAKVRAWGSGHTEALRGQERDCLGKGWGSLRLA